MSEPVKTVAAYRFSFPSGMAYSVVVCCDALRGAIKVRQIRATSGGKFKIGSTFTSECPWCKEKFKLCNFESL